MNVVVGVEALEPHSHAARAAAGTGVAGTSADDDGGKGA